MGDAVTARGASTTVAIARDVHWLRLRGANVYFVRSGEGWVLVDAGFPGSGRAIDEAAGRLCGGGRPAAIVLTHGHPDHAGSAVELGAEWGVPVLAPAREMPFIDGTALYPEPLVAALARLLPRRAMDALVRGSDLGDSVRSFDPDAGVPGLPEWVCVPTPGHTPGHTALFRSADKTLIAGDAVLTMAWSSRLGGRGAGWIWDLARGRTRLTGPPTLVTCDWEAAAASIGTLAGLEPWLLATGHGAPIAGPQVAPALRAFAAACRAEDAKPIRTAARRPLPGSLSEKVFVDVDGVRQGMFIKSRDVSHPVLLFLHGGPGMPEYFLDRTHPTGLENDFTVCWWEQRGAGLSYSSDVPPESMTTEQLIDDAIAVTDYLRERFAQRKVYLLGHSWGSFLGIQVAARAPERYHAYIGMGQVAHQQWSEVLAYRYELEQFRKAGDEKMVRTLEAAPVTMDAPLPAAYMKVRDRAMHRPRRRDDQGHEVRRDGRVRAGVADARLHAQRRGPPSGGARRSRAASCGTTSRRRT